MKSLLRQADAAGVLPRFNYYAAGAVRSLTTSSALRGGRGFWQTVATAPLSPKRSTTATMAARCLSSGRAKGGLSDSVDSDESDDLLDDEPLLDDLGIFASIPLLDDASTTDENQRSALRDPWDLEEMLDSKLTYEDLPDWSPEYVSRTSLERVQIHPDHIPTLQQLVDLPLPPPALPHAGLGRAKSYALYRKRHHYRYVAQQVRVAAADRIPAIQALSTWQDKQDAVDELYEQLEQQLRDREPILGKHPSFGVWVERGLEDYLRSFSKVEEESTSSLNDEALPTPPTSLDADALPTSLYALDADELPTPPPPHDEDALPNPLPSINITVADADTDAAAVPVFMECFDPNDKADQIVPSILSPLSATSVEACGRLVEEWELAAHPTSRRILLRQSTRAVARALVEKQESVGAAASTGPSPCVVLVHGQPGVGKTSALAAVVASARKSGFVVLYLPDGDNLHRHGFYITPNARRPGVYDLPVLSQRVCRQLLDSHETALVDVAVSSQLLDEYFTPDQRKQLPDEGGDLSVAVLLRVGADKTALAPVCYAASVHALKEQEQVPFVMVLDEFNCYFGQGQYFHANYDPKVKNPIPYHKISLFQPAIEAAGLSGRDAAVPFVPIRHGGIVVATSESRGVARATTEALVEEARELQRTATTGTMDVHLVEVPRLSALEVEHVLANYESIGLGKLRLDGGETVRNDQEVQFLRMVSGGVAQKLMNACII